MTKKLVAGGLGDSTVEAARRRWRSWFSHVAQYRDITFRQEELASLKEWVQDQANLAETTALQAAARPYGGDMHAELIRRVRDPDALPPGTRPEDSNPALLTGAAYQLTDECSIWFGFRSDLPDLDA